jgi:hypothetical protein
MLSPTIEEDDELEIDDGGITQVSHISFDEVGVMQRFAKFTVTVAFKALPRLCFSHQFLLVLQEILC